jgi:hypothetical protein
MLCVWEQRLDDSSKIKISIILIIIAVIFQTTTHDSAFTATLNHNTCVCCFNNAKISKEIMSCKQQEVVAVKQVTQV